MADFVDKITPLIIKHAPSYNIKVVSPIIAQAIIESASGTSELAKNANNYFGLKYRAGRMKPWVTTYDKVGSEQRADGSYVSSAMTWCKFKDMEDGVIGYFDFTNISNYSNLKGVTDPRTYLENIKKDGYATALKYVDTVMNIINKNNLTKYDAMLNSGVMPSNPTIPSSETKYTFNVHAGHAAVGGGSTGAVGILNESAENRLIKDKLISILKEQGHTVYDCTVDKGDKKTVLRNIVAKANEHTVDLDVSIHFNSDARGVVSEDGQTTGTEVFIHSQTSSSKEAATRICNNLADLGFKNRGVKVNSSLYILSHLASPSLLIEVCFVNDGDDATLYKSVGVDKIAEAIAKGMIGELKPVINNSNVQVVQTSPKRDIKPAKQNITIFDDFDFAPVYNYDTYVSYNRDVTDAVGTDPNEVLRHFANFGIEEGRYASDNFRVHLYKKNYEDLRKKFGNKLYMYYLHYIKYGQNEGRIANAYIGENEHFLVRIAVPALNVRSGPGLTYSKVGVVRNPSVYTMVDQIGSWGKLKSGLGWIYIGESYVDFI